MVKVLNTLSEFKAAIASPQLSVVDFFAVWCGPCKMIAPQIEKMSQEYAGKVNFFKVDVDEAGDVAQDQDISAMPTLKFYKNGAKVAEVVGANLPKIQQLVKDLQ